MTSQLAIENKAKPNPDTTSVAKQHWRRRNHNPWDTCCDTRAVVAIFRLIHEVRQAYYVDFLVVLECIKAYLVEPMVFDGALDVKVAFADRSQKEIPELVIQVIIALEKEDILEADKTSGVKPRYRLLVSEAELERVYLRLAAEKMRKAQADKQSVLILR